MQNLNFFSLCMYYVCVWVTFHFMKCDSESKVFCVALANETKFFLWFLIFGCLFLRVRYALLHCMYMCVRGVNRCEWVCEYLYAQKIRVWWIYMENKYMVNVICIFYQVSVGSNQDFLTYIISIYWRLTALSLSFYLYIYLSIHLSIHLCSQSFFSFHSTPFCKCDNAIIYIAKV